MLFPEKKSGLVRLSDTLKIGLDLCAETAQQILDIFTPYERVFREAQNLAREAQQGKLILEDAEERIREVLSAVPDRVSFQGAYLQSRLDGLSLSTILGCCFCLESYINSLTHFLFEESDFLGLIKHGHESTVEVLKGAIDRMSTRDKWKTIGEIKSTEGFDRSRSPFQDFHILFNFRDDHVHDKVVGFSEDRAQKRYRNKFPDPVFGLLDLSHAVYAARTHWAMVQEVHILIGVTPSDFQRDYNLAPWRDDEHLRTLEETASLYVRKMTAGGKGVYSR